MVERHTKRKRDDFRPERGCFSEVTVFGVISEVSCCHFGVVSDLDKSLILVLLCPPIALFREEQAHTLTLKTHRGLMGENIKYDHVPGIGGEPFQDHDVMPGQFLRAGLLSGLRKHFPDGPGFFRQMVILLDLIHQGHALFVGEGADFCHEAFCRGFSILIP